MSQPWRTTPGVYVAWGFTNGTFTPTHLAQVLKTWGFGWIVVEDTPENRAAAPTAIADIQAEGLGAGIWAVWDIADMAGAIGFWNPDFIIANQEGSMDEDFPVDFRAAFPAMDAAVVTNFGGISTPTLAHKWRDNGFDCQPEAYTNENPPGTVPAQVAVAVSLGWPTAYPVIGVWNGYSTSNYTADLVSTGYMWSIYLAEGMQTGLYQLLKDAGLLGGTPPPPPALPPPTVPPGPVVTYPGAGGGDNTNRGGYDPPGPPVPDPDTGFATWDVSFTHPQDVLLFDYHYSVPGKSKFEVKDGRLHVVSEVIVEIINGVPVHVAYDAFGLKTIFPDGPAGGITYVRFYMKETSGFTPTTADLDIMTFIDTAHNRMGAIVLTGGPGQEDLGTTRHLAWRGAGYGVGAQNVVLRDIGVDTWHMIEFLFIQSTTISGRMDGASFASQNAFFIGTNGRKLKEILFGGIAHTAGDETSYSDLWFDHIYVSDDVDRSWPGPNVESGTPAKGGVFYLDGFEHGTIVGLSGSGADEIEIVTNPVRSGVFAAKCDGTFGVTPRHAVVAPATPEVVVRLGIHPLSLPSAPMRIFQVDLFNPVIAAPVSAITLDSAGTLHADIDIGDAQLADGPTLTPGNWYALDAAFRYTGSTWTLDWRVRDDQTRVWTTYPSDTVTGHALRIIDRVWFGIVTNPGGNPRIVIDDEVLSSYFFDYPFEKGGILAVFPNADGIHSDPGNFRQSEDGGATMDAVAAGSWALLDERPPTLDDLVAQVVKDQVGYLEYGFARPMSTAAAGASQLSVFRRSRNVGGAHLFSLAYADGTPGTFGAFESVAGPFSTAPQWDVQWRTDFPMVLGVGTADLLPPAWTIHVLDNVRARFGYSLDTFVGDDAIMADVLIIQSIYDDSAFSHGVHIRRRFGSRQP
jgi:hypothetical protein